MNWNDFKWRTFRNVGYLLICIVALFAWFADKVTSFIKAATTFRK